MTYVSPKKEKMMRIQESIHAITGFILLTGFLFVIFELLLSQIH